MPKSFFKLLKRNQIELGLMVVTIVVFFLYGFSEFPILRDHGVISYIAQEVLRGYPPYFTTIAMKTPMSIFIDAFFIKIFSFLPQAIAIRFGMLLISSILVALFYKISYKLFRKKTLAFLSSLILIAFTFFAEVALLGDCKVLLLFFCFISFLFLLRKSFFLSGFFASLCFLSWQPGGLFLLAPISLTLLKNKKGEVKFKNWSKILLGFLIPLLLIVLYFLLNDSLSYFIEYTILFSIEDKMKIILSGSSLRSLLNIVGYYNSELFFIFFAVMGFIFIVYKLLKRCKKKGIFEFIFRKEYLVSISIPFIFLFFYSLGDFQGGPDLIPLLPIISLLSAIFLEKINIVLVKFSTKNLSISLEKAKKVSFGIILTLVCIYGFFPMFQPVYPENPILTEGKELIKSGSIFDMFLLIKERFGLKKSISLLLFRRMGEQITLNQQTNVAKIVTENTKENEKVLSLGAPEIIFLANRRNINRYPLLTGDTFFHMENNVGIDNFRITIMNEKPRFIVTNNKYYIKKLDLNKFLEKDYEEVILQTEEYFMYKLRD